MDWVKVRTSVARDSRWMPAASSWVGSLSRVICQVIFRLFSQVQLGAGGGFFSKTGSFWVSHHIYVVSSTKLRARNSCLAQIKLLCALCLLCMALQICQPAGTCITGYSPLSLAVCLIVRKADIHTLRLTNGHQIS